MSLLRLLRSPARALVALSGLLSGLAWGETTVEPTLKLTAEERYDDAALLRTGPGVGAGQLMTKLSPQVGLGVDDPTLTADTWYSPDLLVHHGSGTVTFDHRGALEVRKRLSRQSDLKLLAQIWRVTDPTSLPRLGVARTLSPILYGKLDLSAGAHLTERIDGRVGYRFEGAKVFEGDRPPGLYHAPFVEGYRAVTRRTALGAEYRFQYFISGGTSDTAHANGAFAALRHRFTRQTTLTAKAGPVIFQGHGAAEDGLLPRATVELARTGEALDLALVAGEDLVGASGFTSALWAHFASVAAGYRFVGPLRVFVAANYFRNGRAPTLGLDPFGPQAAGTAQGYAVGGGVEWRVARSVSVVGSADRFAQVGTEGTEVDVARNIAAVRLVITPWN